MFRRFMILAAAGLAACTLQHTQSAQSGAVDDHMAHMSAADLKPPAANPSTRQQAHPGLPPSANTAPAALAASPRHGEWVKIASAPGSADSIMAWIVYPVSRAKAPVVVVVHEIFGLQTWVRSVADQLAADGFIAIAPDFLSRVRGGPSTVELTADSAQRAIRGVAITERNNVIVAAANFAMTQPSAEPHYGVVGFCWGGQTVWGHAVHGGVKGYGGGVAYYGAFPFTNPGRAATATTAATPATVNVDSLARINAPLMLLNGSADARIAAQMPELDSLMKNRKKDYLGMNYEGAIHGFARAQDDPLTPTARDTTPERLALLKSQPAANLAAIKDAWPKTIAFFRKNLK